MQTAECRVLKGLCSAIFNPHSAIGYWLSTILAFAAGSTHAATNVHVNPDEIPPLRPPKPEILPRFWEEHGLLVSVMGLMVVLAGILVWRILARPRPPLIPEPAAVACQALVLLREQSEDAGLFAEISLILRRYFVAALQLSEKEFTNHELCQQLAGHPRVQPMLSAAASDLLEDMEHRRFGTHPPHSQMHSVDRALDLIRQTEACLQPPPVEAGSTTAAA